MRKLIVFVETFALTALTVTAIIMNPQAAQMMIAASQAANSPQETAARRIIAFAQAAGTVAMLTVHPQSAKPRPQWSWLTAVLMGRHEGAGKRCRTDRSISQVICLIVVTVTQF
jgi:hypothetical protein